MAKTIIKKLIERIKSTGGRSRGTITAPRIGNYSRKLYRFVDFKRDNWPNVIARVIRTDIIDPNRTARLALMVFPQGCMNYIIAPENLKLGEKIINNAERGSSKGSSFKLNKVSSGSLMFNLTLAPKMPSQYIRSAGSSAILVKNNKELTLFKLKSGEYRYFYSNTIGVLGKVSNGDYFLKSWDLAGKSRRLGIRPRNRPLARNPVDHPMGGRTKGGTPKLTPKGRIALNTETKKKKNRLVIIKAREKKKI